MKVYSEYEDEFSDGDYQMAVEQCFNENTKVADVVTIFEGDATHCTHSDFINGGNIVENIRLCAYDAVGEYSDTYLEQLTENDCQELERLILKWVSSKAKDPTFYTVDNIKPIQVTVTDEML